MSAELPTTLLAELTHRCPLHCPYCSNPLELVRAERELTTDDWLRVLEQARALGVLQLGLSGGEPLVRQDLETIAAHARGLGFYTTLVTSGLGLTRARAQALRATGLEHIQVSLQDADTVSAERIAGVGSVRQKLAAAALVRELEFAFSLNVVLHRANIDHVGALIELAVTLGADRLELANTQYYGWGLRNRAALMPTREQVGAAERVVRAAKDEYRGRLRITYVLPDYHGIYPKPCYGGWGRSYIVVTPDGATARPASKECNSTTCATARSNRSGANRRPSMRIGEKRGWSRPAGIAPADRSTSGGAAVRPSRSRVMPQPPTRSARSRRGDRSSTRRSPTQTASRPTSIVTTGTRTARRAAGPASRAEPRGTGPARGRHRPPARRSPR